MSSIDLVQPLPKMTKIKPVTYLVVSHPVIVEVARGCEPFAAGQALMRLLPAVDASKEEPRQIC